MMQDEYKKYTIKYNEFNELFEVTIGDSDITSKTLKDIKEKIDKYIKKENKFERINILTTTGWRNEGLKEGQITSIADDDHNYPQVWIMVNGNRSKKSLSDNIFLDTPGNRVLYSQIQGKETTIEALKKEIKEIYTSMEKPDLKLGNDNP